MAGINLTEIQQKVDRLLFNIAEQNRRAYEVFFSPTPAEVELPQLDEKGNLVSVKIPNRALVKKQMWDDVKAAVGLWNRTFYIHPDGDDTAPGTADAPLKTIEKAFELIPPGATAVLYARGEFTINDHLGLDNNFIILYPWDGELTINQGVYRETSDYIDLASFMLRNSSIFFYGYRNKEKKIKINTFKKSSEKSLYRTMFTAIGYGNVGAMCCVLNQYDGGFAECYDSMGSLSTLDLNIYNCDVTIHNIEVPFARIYYKALFSWAGDSPKDSSGNALQLADIIDGIVRDSDGKPRNIISNAVL